jgi:tyrosyl-tRNA synthetase
VFPLLEGLDGSAKMGKSLNNYIGLTEPPEQIYGKTMSIPDKLIEKYLRLVSGLNNNDVMTTLASGPRIAKGALARQLVRRLHGEEAAARAEEAFVSQFVKRDYTANLEEFKLTGGAADPVSILVATGVATSRGDAARLIEQGGFRVNGEKRGNDRMLEVGDIISARRRNIQLK